MPASVLAISDSPGPIVEVHGPRCDRRGAVCQGGAWPSAPGSLPDLLGRLSPDCPARIDMKNHACGATYPVLPAPSRASLGGGD